MLYWWSVSVYYFLCTWRKKPWQYSNKIIIYTDTSVHEFILISTTFLVCFKPWHGSSSASRYTWNIAKVVFKHQSINQSSASRYTWNIAKVVFKHQSINQSSASRLDIPEILLKLSLNTNQSINHLLLLPFEWAEWIICAEF